MFLPLFRVIGCSYYAYFVYSDCYPLQLVESSRLQNSLDIFYSHAIILHIMNTLSPFIRRIRRRCTLIEFGVVGVAGDQ